jgi:hypothetical protein
MNIIFGKDVADQVRDKYTTLELETFNYDGEVKTAYCILPSECISLGDLPDLERKKELHQAVIDALNRHDYSTVLHGIEHLKGSFNGEMDSFYIVIEDRIKGLQIDKLQN